MMKMVKMMIKMKAGVKNMMIMVMMMMMMMMMMMLAGSHADKAGDERRRSTPGGAHGGLAKATWTRRSSTLSLHRCLAKYVSRPRRGWLTRAANMPSAAVVHKGAQPASVHATT